MEQRASGNKTNPNQLLLGILVHAKQYSKSFSVLTLGLSQTVLKWILASFYLIDGDMEAERDKANK